MRCPRCGNENPATNRFCGSCGASLASAAPATVRTEHATQTTAVRNASVPASSAPLTTSPAAPSSITAQRTAPPVSREVPGISGPSFLGLNAPPPSRSGKIPNLQRDAHHGPPSRNLDYLLDDEEEHKGAAGKIFLILIALALALGFGYLRWRHEGLSALWPAQKKPAAAETAEASHSATDTAANAPDSSSPPAISPPATGTPSTAPPTGSASQPAAAATDSSSPAAAASTPTSPDKSAPDAAAADHATNAASPPAAASVPPADKPAADDSGSAAAPASSEESSAPAPVAAAKPTAKPRPVPKPTPAKAFDQVAEAEKYIYGRGGARQDCDRGLRMLRPAAEQSNPRAMISLGALYSTGVCTPRDLPTAYRWFALALRKQPDNQPLQENLQRLWSQMTQPERQLAVKLSQ